MEQLPDWIWEVDLDLVVHYSNPGSERVLGFTVSEMVGSCVLDCAPDDQEIAKIRDIVRRARTDSRALENLILRFRHKDGSIRVVHTNAGHMTDAEGRVIGFRGVTRDVTEQEATKEIVTTLLANYRAVTDYSPIGVFIQQNEKAVYANARMLELVEYEWEDRERVGIWDIIHPDDLERIKGYYSQRMRGEPSPETYEVRVLTKSGELRHFEIKATTVTYSGAPAVLGNVIDITDRKRAEEALRSNERFLQSVFDSIQDGISILDREFNIVRVNKTMESWYSHALPLIGKKCYAAYHGRSELCEVCPSRRSLEHLDTQMDILPLIGADGGVKGWHELYSCPLMDDRGNVIGIVEHVRDITARVQAEAALRENEEKYRTLVETVSDWVWEVDENARYTYAGPQIRSLLGYEPEEVLGKTPFDLMPLYEAERIAAEFGPIAESHEPFSLLDNVLLHRDGREVAVQTSGTPVFDSEGLFRGYRGIDRDITEKVLIERELRNRTAELEAITGAFPDIYFYLDTQHRIVDYHAVDVRELYVPPSAFLGKRFEDVLPAEVGAAFVCAVEDAIRSGAIQNLVYRLPILSEERHFEARVVAMADKRVLVVIRDITERHIAEEALHYRLDFEQVITSISTRLISATWQETDKAIDFALESVGRFMKVDRSYVFVNRPDRTIMDETHEWCADGVSPSIQAFQAVPLEEHRWVVDRLRKKQVVSVPNIEDLPVEAETTKEMARVGGNRSLILVPMLWMGQWIGFMGLGSLVERDWPEDTIVLLRVVGELLTGAIVRERSEEALRESEERYRRLVDMSPDAITVSVDGKFVLANTAALAMNNATEPEQIVGMSVTDAIAPAYREVAAERMRMLTTGSMMWLPPTEEKFIRLDGTEFDGEISATRILYQGKPAILSVLRDITERKRAEEHKRALEKQLESQKRHFYRETILSVTDGKLSICDPPELRPYISRATLKFHVRSAEQVAEARHLAEEFLREQGLEHERLDSFIIGVGEAITNAIKHARGGRLYAGMTDDGSLWVGVADRGSGISSLILPRATLLRGFSTKPSLGLGYTIMLEVADSMLLKTGDTGTTVILVQKKRQPTVEITPEALPDTWEQAAI